MTHNSSTARKQSVYCAPSWSWASVKGQLDWPSRTIDEHCRDDFTGQILAVHLDVLSENPMGAVLGGFVTIRGRIRRLSQVVKPVEWGALLRFRYNLICDDELVGNGSFDVDGHGEDGEVWILQIQTQKPFDCYKPYHPTALLLRKATSSNNRFERLGIAVLEDEKLDFFDRCPAREFEFV